MNNYSKENIKNFTFDINTLKKKAYESIGQEDFKHLIRVEWYGRIATLLGYSTAWIFPNPFSAFCLSLGQFTRWLLAHHIMHRGYDRIPNIPERYTSKGFAKGRRRFLDWFDWIHPKAWDYEHNYLHHYHTGEHQDPDLVERNAEFLRKSNWPKFLKYIFMLFFSITWKFSYYAPNTISCLDKDCNRVDKNDLNFLFLNDVFKFKNPQIRNLWLYCYLPYGLWHFILIPSLFLLISFEAALFVLINKMIAELMTNFHSFLIIGPNHAGDDLHRYDFHYENKEEFYLTQVLSSVNYNCGKEWKDYLQIWLNYQIEHHLFPDLPMLKYREIQPEVKAICEKYNVPYIQESVFKRFYKMLRICVGSDTMLSKPKAEIL
jgi:fatty acid desaturase